MAVTINASTSAGLVQTADTSGVLALQTAGTTAVTVNASQNVGVGTASPAVKLDVVGAISASGLISANNQLKVVNTSNDFGTIQLGTSSSYKFTGGATFSGYRFEVPAGTQYDFFVDGASKVLLNSFGVGLGGASPSSGAGITFPATQSASSNANTLDDYEEGTWTPAFAFSTSGSVTYSTQAGYYRKVGSLVFVECNISIASVSSPTGNVTVNNLPFTVSNQSANVASMSLGLVRSLVNAKPNIRAYCDSNSTTILFPVNDTISGSSELQGADLKASTLIYVSGCFITD